MEDGPLGGGMPTVLGGPDGGGGRGGPYSPGPGGGRGNGPTKRSRK